MKVKNVELLGLVDDLGHLVIEKIKLKVKGNVYLLLERIKPLMDSYDKVRKEFIKEYGIGNEKEGYSIPPESWDKMGEETKKEWKELNEQEQKIESRLKLDDLEDIESSHRYQFLFKVLE